jgi:hypothetical protein
MITPMIIKGIAHDATYLESNIYPNPLIDLANPIYIFSIS